MTTEYQGRGQLTTNVLDVAVKHTPVRGYGGWEFDQTTLRLIPYIFTLALDHGRLNPARISSLERTIISNWRKAGWLTGGASERIRLSSDFADYCYRILKAAYLEAD